MSISKDKIKEIEDIAFNNAKEILDGYDIPICFGNMPIPEFRPIIFISDFSVKEVDFDEIKEKQVQKAVISAKQAVNCAHCQLFDRCFSISILGYLDNIGFAITRLQKI